MKISTTEYTKDELIAEYGHISIRSCCCPMAILADIIEPQAYFSDKQAYANKWIGCGWKPGNDLCKDCRMFLMEES